MTTGIYNTGYNDYFYNQYKTNNYQTNATQQNNINFTSNKNEEILAKKKRGLVTPFSRTNLLFYKYNHLLQ